MAAKGQAQAPVVRHDVLALGGSAQERQGLGERGHLSERQRCLDAEHLPAGLVAVAAKPPQGIGRGQRLQVTAVQAGAPGEVLDIPEGARGGDPLGTGTGQALDHPEPQPQGGRVALQGAVPVTDTDIDRPHLDPMAPGILHELGGGIETHGLAVQTARR